MSKENGVTQLWPGTHLDTSYCTEDGAAHVSSEKLEKWRQINPPVQLDIKRGSILIRDVRLWHAGMPNFTQTPRPMIAMIHMAEWMNSSQGSDNSIVIPERSRDFFSDHETLVHATTVIPNDQFNHLLHGNPYDVVDTEKK